MVISLETKKLISSICCPICKGQIDSKNKDFIFSCAKEDHYMLHITNYNSFDEEKIAILDREKFFHYEISKIYGQNNRLIHTIIDRFPTQADYSVRYQKDHEKKLINYDVFNFRNFNPETAINKIRTIMTFD